MKLLQRIGLGVVLSIIALTSFMVSQGYTEQSNGGIYQSWNSDAAITSPTDSDSARYVTMSFPILLTSLDTPADLVTDFVMPFKGSIVSWQLVDEVVATSGGTADADIELQLGATTVTGSAITAFTQANLDAIGEVKAGGTITAANTFIAGGTFSIVCTESAVNFTAGKVNAYVTFLVTNTSLASKIEEMLDVMRSQKHIKE